MKNLILGGFFGLGLDFGLANLKKRYYFDVLDILFHLVCWSAQAPTFNKSTVRILPCWVCLRKSQLASAANCRAVELSSSLSRLEEGFIVYSYYKSLWWLSAINYRMLLSIPGLNPPPSVARVNQTRGRN